MSYEDAPATKMLATYCAVCGRPLVDANSVEAGIGPDCRRKYGYNDPCGDEARMAANKLVHDIAIRQDGLEVLESCVQLRSLGFEKLADRITDRVARIRIELVNGDFIVETPYDAGAVEKMRSVRGRRWDRERKVNIFPSASRPEVWAILKSFFMGALGIGPRGPFVVA